MIITNRLITLIIWRNNKVMVAVDRQLYFNKVSQCPILLPVPKTKKQIDFLEEKMKWLLTEEGRKASAHYEFDKWITKYPKVY